MVPYFCNDLCIITKTGLDMYITSPQHIELFPHTALILSMHYFIHFVPKKKFWLSLKNSNL